MSKSKEDIEKALLFWDRLFWWVGVGGCVVSGIATYFSIKYYTGLYGTLGVPTVICLGIFVACVVVVNIAYIREEQLKKKR